MNRTLDEQTTVSVTILKVPVGLVCVIATLMLAQGCAYRDWKQRKQLFDAVLHNNVDKVQVLLESGLDPNTEGYKGGRAISYAHVHDDPRIVTLLIEHGACVDDNHAELALKNAISSGADQVVRVLLGAGVDPNGNYYWGNTPLMVAAEKGSLEILETLLDYGGDPNFPGTYSSSVVPRECKETALSLAAANGHAEAVRLLLDHGANSSFRDSFDCTAAMAAKRAGHRKVATIIEAEQPAN